MFFFKLEEILDRMRLEGNHKILLAYINELLYKFKVFQKMY
jgi:hypothetical protein